MNDDTTSLDFEVGPEKDTPSSLKNSPQLQEASRQSFRLPIQKVGSVKVQISDHSLDLVNLVARNKTGIGVRVSSSDTFSIGQQLQNIQFSLGDTDFDLQGRVQHISPDNVGCYLCGIELIDMSVENTDALHRYIDELRTNIFQALEK